jgi:hypothetical protein
MPSRTPLAIRNFMTTLRAGHRRRSDEWMRRMEGPVHRYPHRVR